MNTSRTFPPPPPHELLPGNTSAKTPKCKHEHSKLIRNGKKQHIETHLNLEIGENIKIVSEEDTQASKSVYRHVLHTQTHPCFVQLPHARGDQYEEYR